MSERTINVSKSKNGIIVLESKFIIFPLPDSEIDAIMEDIKNLRRLK